MAKFKGRNVKLNKPFRTPSASKKFGVYVRNKKTNKIQIVRFGAKGMSIGRNDPKRQRSFFARFRPILADVRRSGKQVTLAPSYWAIQSWKKGFRI